MSEAWLIPKGHDPEDATTPSAVQLPCIEGTRILSLDDCTVSVISVFPDGSAYVITRKTFPKAVIDAGRRKWKTENHASHYGMNQEQWQSQYQGGFDYASQQQQQANPFSQQQRHDPIRDAYLHDLIDEFFRKGKY